MRRQVVLWTAGIVLFGALLFAVGRFSMRNPALQGPPAYSLSPGVTGMISSGTGYLYSVSTNNVASVEEVVPVIQRYLDRQGNPDLALARLRELTWAYEAEVIERSTGRHAFGLMVSKSTAQISPKAGPNLFWNTKYGPMIAEVGGGYGMIGRLLSRPPVAEMPITASRAQEIAEEAVAALKADLTLDDEMAVFYGFYEFYVLRDGQAIGELDVNGYNGQVWYKDWGEPQLSVRDLAPSP